MQHFTSDLHFFHKLMMKERNFSSLEEMNQSLIDSWNKAVNKQDEVWFLGDLSFSNPSLAAEILNKLNGKIHWVLGNHDHGDFVKKISKLYQFASIQNDAKIKIEPCHLQKDQQDIVMYHYPIAIWNKRHWGAYHLHGHSHAHYFVEKGFILDVGVDSAFKILGEYRPFSLDEVIAYMKTRQIGLNLDHHDSQSPR